jgi:hypothetical protein
MEINYCSSSPYKDYVERLKRCRDIFDVHVVLAEYQGIYNFPNDLLNEQSSFDEIRFILDNMTSVDTDDKMLFLIEKYGEIILPRKEVLVSIIADKFKVPYGTAFIQYGKVNQQKHQ